jgi:hypothetical protein
MKILKTITVIGSNRPAYMAKALSSISVALAALAQNKQPSFDRLIISLDSDASGKLDHATMELREGAMDILSRENLVECFAYTTRRNMGCGAHHLAALANVYEYHGSDFNVLVEDDARLSPDALHFANWFQANHCGPFADYLLAAMCNHLSFGRGGNPGGIPDKPSFVAESPIINSPFAWCMSKYQWPFVKCAWESKREPPHGWDFSLSYNMRLARKKTLHPVVSRCANIGEFGVHETPESFRKTQLGVLISDGSYFGNFDVVLEVPHQDMYHIDDWMLAEHGRMFRGIEKCH